MLHQQKKVYRMGTNIYPHDFVKQRHQMLSRLVESYSDVLEPRKPREAVRLFMETGLWVNSKAD